MTSYIIRGNLSEKQIETDVAMYLGWCSAGLPFQLLDVNEQLTGADKLFDVVMPIYLQFKKSTGLKPLTAALSRRRANESALQRVREFRRQHQLDDDPTLYFQLRAKAEHAADLQHNVLLAHHQPERSYAIYVAPLYLDRQSYYDELTRGPRFMGDPWRWSDSEIWHGGERLAWLSRFDRQPFLRNHVTIAPHERVADHKHYYAYSDAGDAVSWHSPTMVDGGDARLSDFMSQRVRQFLLSEDKPSAQAGLQAARRALDELNMSSEVPLDEGEPLDSLRRHGLWLWKTYEIRQILICSSKEMLQRAMGR